jgi:hypothetical protein
MVLSHDFPALRATPENASRPHLFGAFLRCLHDIRASGKADSERSWLVPLPANLTIWVQRLMRLAVAFDTQDSQIVKKIVLPVPVLVVDMKELVFLPFHNRPAAFALFPFNQLVRQFFYLSLGQHLTTSFLFLYRGKG